QTGLDQCRHLPVRPDGAAPDRRTHGGFARAGYSRENARRHDPRFPCRPPFRISLFGGGTDYPGWYREHGGAVVGGTINKYCYITFRSLPPFFEHRHRIVYSRIELPQHIDEIQHPSVRCILREYGVEEGVEIQHYGDLPARSGMGSSSSFT